MYLSKLVVSTLGEDGLAGRRWLADAYRVHQRIFEAFPNRDESRDRILYRVEGDYHPPRVLVQAPITADWDTALAGIPVSAEQKEVRLDFAAGQRLRFRLRANPTIRRKRDLKDPTNEEKAGKRYGLLKEKEQRAWLRRKGELGGFRVEDDDLTIRPRGQAKFKAGKGANERRETHVDVTYEGYLTVTDPSRFLAALEAGIGAAKGYGFGLLSIAPA